MRPAAPADPGLARLADQARTLYCQEMRLHLQRTRGQRVDYGAEPLPHWDGGVDGSGYRHDSAWLKIARFCRQHGFEVARLIRCLFAASEGGAAPTPPQCCSARAEQLYRQLGERIESEQLEQLKADLVAQLRLVQLQQGLRRPLCNQYGWTLADLLQGILRDPTVALTVLFRYCLARREGWAELAAELEPRALAQFAGRPDGYRRAWGEVLPPELLTAPADFPD